MTLDGPNITLTAPGAVAFHAGSHQIAGPKAASPEAASFSKAPFKGCPQKLQDTMAASAAFTDL